jgi:hypothetical protein
MEEIRNIAFETVMRACGFGSLAIFCIMVGLSFEPRLSFQTGGILMLLMVAILAFKAREATTKPYRRTEMWLYLPEELRPPERSAQQTISKLMRETYLTFAYWSALMAVGMLVIALAFALIGI